MAMANLKRGKEINQLAAVELRSLPDGKHADGAGLFLIVRGDSRAWVVTLFSRLHRNFWHTPTAYIYQCPV